MSDAFPRHYDRNADGVISADEIAYYTERERRPKANNEQRSPMLLWRRYDRNADGVIDANEAPAFVRQFDRNGDGVLAGAELAPLNSFQSRAAPSQPRARSTESFVVPVPPF